MSSLTDTYTFDRCYVRYDTLAPLEHMASVHYVVALIDCDEIKKSLANKRLITATKLLDSIAKQTNALTVPPLIYEKLLRIASHVAYEICEWIKYHDEQIFNVGRKLHRVALQYIDAIRWTPRGTIDYPESARRLIKFHLSDDVKLRIAYAYSLEDLVVEYMPKVRRPGYLQSVFAKHGRDFLPRSALYYWICYTFGDTAEVERVYGYGIRSDCRVEEFLFNVFIRMPNHVLTKQIWTKLTPDERIERTMDLMTTNVLPTDLQLYFLSQLTVEQQTVIINGYLPYVFRILVDDIHIRSFTEPLVRHLWASMTSMDFVEITKLLFSAIDASKANPIGLRKYQQIYKYFWTTTAPLLRRQVLENHYQLELQRRQRLRGWQLQNHSALFPLNWIDNEDIVELIMSDATLPQRKCFLKTDSAVRYAAHLVKNGSWSTLESFVSRFLANPDDLREYKVDLLIDDDFALIKHFCQFEPNQNSDFYDWCFESESRRRKFVLEKRAQMWYKLREFFATKQHINHVRSFLQWCLLTPHEQREWLQQFTIDVWYDLIKCSDKIDIVDIEYFLDWSFETTNIVHKSRTIIPRHTQTLVKFVCALMKKENFRLLERLLEWCFLYDQSLIRQFKNEFYDNCSVSDFCDLMHHLVVVRIDRLTFFDTVFGTWFADGNDFRTFKLKITQPRTATWIGADFVNRRRANMADRFFKYCADFSDEQMVQFKLDLFLHESMAGVLGHYGKYETFVASFVQWIDPPPEKYEIFERRFLSDTVDVETRITDE